MQRYESYKPSVTEWLGNIPSHWTEKKSKFLWREKEDRSLLGNEELLSVSQYSGIVPRAEDSRSESLEDYKKCQPDDLVINIMLAWLGGLGVSNHIGIVSPAYCVYRQLENHNPQYLGYLYRTPLYLAEFARRSKGIVPSRWRMYTEDFGQVLTLLPPSDEQDRIVAFLDQKTAEIDAAIAKKKRLIELLQEQKGILINQAVTRGLSSNVAMRDSGIEWIGSIPAHYRMTRLGFVATIGNGSTPNRSTLGYWHGGDIPWLNSSKVNDFQIVEADQFITQRAARECHLPLVRAGSLLVAITGEGKTRGMAALTKIDATINQHLAYITVADTDVEPEFLLYYLTGIYQILRDESSSQGCTKSAITCGELRKVPVMLPPLDEQRDILDQIKGQIGRIEQSVANAQGQMASLNELKSIVVADAISGRMKV